MDIVITTSDPTEVSVNEVRDLIEDGDYWVNSVVVQDRSGHVHARPGRPL